MSVRRLRSTTATTGVILAMTTTAYVIFNPIDNEPWCDSRTGQLDIFDKRFEAQAAMLRYKMDFPNLKFAIKKVMFAV